MDGEKIPIQIQIQDGVELWLTQKKLFPSGIVYVTSLNSKYIPILKISFMFKEQLEDFREVLEIKSMCDKSGYQEYTDNLTVILSGMILQVFFRKIGM